METNLHASGTQCHDPKLSEQESSRFDGRGETVMTTKLDAPYTTFSIREGIRAPNLHYTVDRAVLTQSKLDPKSHSTQEVSEARTGVSEMKDNNAVADNPAPLEDFLNDLSSMPPHRHIKILHTHGRSGQQDEVQSHEPPFEPFTNDSTAAKLRHLPAKYPIIRKFRSDGIFAEVRLSVPLSQFQWVQSNIHNAVKKVRRSTTNIEELQSQSAAASFRNMDVLDQQRGTSNAVADFEGMKIIREPVGKDGPRIRKHPTEMTYLTNLQASRLVRAKVIEELASGDEQETKRKRTAEESLESSMQPPIIGAMDSLKGRVDCE